MSDNQTIPPLDSLDEFTQGYFEGLFFTEDGPEEDGGSIGEKTYSEFAPATVKAMIEDCAAFQRVNAAALSKAYERHDYTERQAGIDFWLSRNDHGAGFFDRGLNDLQDACGWRTAFPEVNLYVSDAGQVCHG